MFVLLVLFWAAPGPSVRADGLVIRAAPPGEAGPQMDASRISPAQRAAPPAASTPRTYVVQRGDTLSAIAARFDTSVAALMSQNGLASADRVEVGRVLQISASSLPLPELPRDGALARVQFWPWPPVQGQTVAVWLHTRAAVSLTLRFGASTIPVVTEGRASWALAPIEALAAPETRPMTVTAGSMALAFPVPIRAGVFEVQEIAAEASDPILSQVAKVNAEYARVTELFAGRTGGQLDPAGPVHHPAGGRRGV